MPETIINKGMCMDGQEKVKALINNLAGAVINAVRGGSREERKRLADTLKDMDSHMPGVSEDAAQAKEFLQALISLLEGKPISSEALSDMYRGIYEKVVEMALAAGNAMPPPTARADADPETEIKEFLTQLSAAVVLVIRGGSEEEKKALAAKLLDIKKGLQAGQEDAGIFITALVSLLENNPVPPESLPPKFIKVYRRITESLI